MNHKESQFWLMVAQAESNLSGDCPLIQDEAIIWASEKITELLQKGNMNAKLTEELEGEIRSKVNPQYKDRIGTESYERDALLQEIDILRAAIKQTYDDNAELTGAKRPG